MKLEFSAGGVVFKKTKILKPVQDDIRILVSQHSQHHGWVFPKGLIDNGVTKEHAAIREVAEEVGVIGKIIESLKPVVYWYQMDGVKRKKTVHYFLMEYISGDITIHDWEMENVEWLPMDKVADRLTYPSDKKVWKQANKLLAT